MNQQCIVCHKIMQGRSDKKYCSDGCRYAANNLKRKERPEATLIANINSTLRKNRHILKGLNPAGKTIIGKEYLVWQGFDFRYHTHQYQTIRGNTYNFCYEYGYLLLPEEKVLVVKWQSNIDTQNCTFQT